MKIKNKKLLIIFCFMLFISYSTSSIAQNTEINPAGTMEATKMVDLTRDGYIDMSNGKEDATPFEIMYGVHDNLEILMTPEELQQYKYDHQPLWKKCIDNIEDFFNGNTSFQTQYIGWLIIIGFICICIWLIFMYALKEKTNNKDNINTKNISNKNLIKGHLNMKNLMSVKLTLFVLCFLIVSFFDWEFDYYNKLVPANKFSYSFYELLRIIVSGYFLYSAFLYYKRQGIEIGFIVSLFICILYNPVHKLSFSKDTWFYINEITIVCLLLLSKQEIKNCINAYKEKK